MHGNLFVVWLIVWQLTRTDEAVLRPLVRTDKNPHPVSIKNFSNETHFTWILYPPWKRHDHLLDDKASNHSAEYFTINKPDSISNQSYIETSELTACKVINVTFSSKMHQAPDKINLILFTYQRNTWNKAWEYMHNNAQWQLHQLSINISDQNEDIRLRLLPISNSFSNQISIDISIPNIVTNTNCDNLNERKFPVEPVSNRRSTSTIHLFLFIVFGSVFLLLFLTIMAAFVYGLIVKQYNRWIRKHSSGRRRRGRKARNVIRDESTVIGGEINTV